MKKYELTTEKKIIGDKTLYRIKALIDFRISSKEFKKAMGIEGEIQNLGLYTGRSPNDKENNVSADKDIWYINTIEIKKITKNQTKGEQE